MTDILLSRRALVAGATAVGVASLAGAAPASASLPTVDTPGEALARLFAGNLRFRTGHARHPRQSPADVRRLAAGQDPFVVVLGCADSRVAPEVLFDQGLGDVFDDRVAGNAVDPIVLGSMEYAVAEFAPPLLMVLGHERCGAVAATVEAVEHGTTPPGNIAAVVEALRPPVEAVLHQPGDTVENAVRANVRHQIREMLARSPIIRAARDAGTLAVVGARYDLDHSRVTLV